MLRAVRGHTPVGRGVRLGCPSCSPRGVPCTLWWLCSWPGAQGHAGTRLLLLSLAWHLSEQLWVVSGVWGHRGHAWSKGMPGDAQVSRSWYGAACWPRAVVSRWHSFSEGFSYLGLLLPLHQAHGNTALHMAAALHCHRNQKEIIQLLLDHGADPSIRNLDNDQPIHMAPPGKAGDQVRPQGN